MFFKLVSLITVTFFTSILCQNTTIDWNTSQSQFASNAGGSNLTHISNTSSSGFNLTNVWSNTQSDWNTFRTETAGFQSIAVGPIKPNIQWSYNAFMYGYVSPSVSLNDNCGSFFNNTDGNKGVIFIPAVDGYVYALSPYNGELFWKYPTTNQVQATPAIHPDTCNIYFGSDDSTFNAINAEGSSLWSKQYQFPFIASPVFDSDGNIIVGNIDSYLYSFNATDGKENWKKVVGNPGCNTCNAIYSTAVIDANNISYVGSIDGKLYSFNSKGDQLWNYTTGGIIDSSPALLTSRGAAGRVVPPNIIVGSYDGNLYSISTDGSQRWNFTTGGPIVSSPAIFYLNGQSKNIYIGSTDGNLYSLSIYGTLLWSYPTGNAIVSSPAVDQNNIVYVGSNDGNLYALNSTNNGTLLWSIQTGDPIVSSPVIDSSGQLYFGSSDQTVYAINTTNSTKIIQPISIPQLPLKKRKALELFYFNIYIYSFVCYKKSSYLDGNELNIFAKYNTHKEYIFFHRLTSIVQDLKHHLIRDIIYKLQEKLMEESKGANFTRYIETINFVYLKNNESIKVNRLLQRLGNTDTFVDDFKDIFLNEYNSKILANAFLRFLQTKDITSFLPKKALLLDPLSNLDTIVCSQELGENYIRFLEKYHKRADVYSEDSLLLWSVYNTIKHH